MIQNLDARRLFAGLGSPGTFVAAAALTMLTRLPLLSASGYGTTADAWRIVAAGAYLAEHGNYVVSRFPGYPLVELAVAGLWSAGLGSPVAVGLATALISAVGAGALAVLLRLWGVRYAVTGAVAAALVPTVFLESVTAMDYVWAASFGLVSILAAARGRPAWVGLALGIAIGCRPTAALMAVPALVLVAGTGRWPAAAKMLAVGAAVALVFWLPVFVTYGVDFIHADAGAVPLANAVRMATTGTWGVLGLAAIVLAVGGLERSRLVERRTEAGALVSGIALYGLLYLVMPHQSGYLIPAVPLVIALFALLLPPARFMAVCVLIMASPFVLDVKGNRETTVAGLGSIAITDNVLLTGAGPAFHRRSFDAEIARRGMEMLDAIERLPEGSAVAVGGMQAVVTVMALRHGRPLPAGLTTAWPPRTDPMSRTADAAWLPDPPADPHAIYCTRPEFVRMDFSCIPLFDAP